ncbi:hypothetical protein [Streptomyces niveus]|uniref:hypothetical protein n=1 Tax=Streptomyces niveus TaxID=193462 RepID=UPI0036736890
MSRPEPDWDWATLVEHAVGLAALAIVLDREPLPQDMRRVALERFAAEAAETTKIAEFIAARAKELESDQCG